ncbi:Crp/Fnr family transcriptional regulator [Christensenellaceae bacterium OttesenSCG-928-K19]|nr:Crp/Fnr family transcriptional regulator [Christensenellaceae bacterium OttesenSCG-928-K19]
MNILSDKIKNVKLFSGIAEQDLSSLLSCLSAVVKSYKKDEIIFLSGQPAQSVGIICSGSVHVFKEDFIGNRTIISALSAGELFGESFACAQTSSIPVSVVATADSKIMLIDYRKIITTCPTTCTFHSRLVENMLGILAYKNVELDQKVDVISRRTTREKLIAFLSEQARKLETNCFTIPFNRQELADYLCVERSAMSAELSKMQKNGIIETNKNEFKLLYIPGDPNYDN